MNRSTLEDLPFDVFDVVCSYLNPFDIAKLEQASRNVFTTIQELNLWKKVAVKFIRNSDVPAVQDVLKNMKLDEFISPRYCKIVIGLTVITMKIMNDLGGSMNDSEAIYYITTHRECLVGTKKIQRIIEGQMKFFLKMKMMKLEPWLKKTKIRCILGCYDKALRIKCGNEGEELSLDVMNYINEFKSDANGFVELHFVKDSLLV